MYFRKCLYYSTILLNSSFSPRFTHVGPIYMYFKERYKSTKHLLVQMYNLFSRYTNFCTNFFKLFLLTSSEAVYQFLN